LTQIHKASTDYSISSITTARTYSKYLETQMYTVGHKKRATLFSTKTLAILEQYLIFMLFTSGNE